MLKQFVQIAVKLLLCMIIFWTTYRLSLCQDRPLESDTENYKIVYGILFDSEARARSAEKILLVNGTKTPSELDDRELWLLYRVYNELGALDEQFAIAMTLWNRSPKSDVAMSCMYSTLRYRLSKNRGGPQEVITFIEDSLRNGTGNRRDLLTLKATAILNKEGTKDAQTRLEVSELLIEAFAAGASAVYKNDPYHSSPDIIDTMPEFVSYFSKSERETLKLRMLNRRDRIMPPPGS